MATHNPKESRKTCESTLAYMLRGDNHEHQLENVVHLGGNILSNPTVIGSNLKSLVDLKELAAELNHQASRHKGRGEDLFKHYVISLAPDESLMDYQWLELITAYMEALGFDSTTKWTAVEHKDTNASHVHILACRVKGDKFGSLVSTYKDYEKGWPVMRAFEKKFGLRQIENPDESFGKNKSKAQIKANNKESTVSSTDETTKIRAAFKRLYSEFGKPRTMRDLALGLAKCGVELKVSSSDSGEITGINYKLKAGRGSWIPGSKVKATRFTWGALQKKEGISYDAVRDDPFLRRVEGAIEVQIKLQAKLDHFILKHSALKLEYNRRLLAKFHMDQDADLESLMKLVNALLIIISVMLGIRINIDNCELSITNPQESFKDLPLEENYKDQPLYHSKQFSEEDLKLLRASKYWINSDLIRMKEHSTAKLLG